MEKSNYFFKELFSHDTESRYSKKCYECKIKFRSCRQKKNHSFLVHCAHFGGANTSLPINVLRRSVITYYSISFLLHKSSYDFYDAKKAVDDFSVAFERVFNPQIKSQAPRFNGTNKLYASRYNRTQK